MQCVYCTALLVLLVCYLVQCHVLDSGLRDSTSQRNRRNRSSSDSSQNSNQNTDSNRTQDSGVDEDDADVNVTDSVNTTASPLLITTVGDPVFQIRERNRRFRLQRIRQQILRRLGWTEPPNIPEDVRRHLTLNQSYPLLRPEIEIRDERMCLTASCMLPRQIDRHLWEDSELGGFRLFTSVTRAQHIPRSNLREANLNVHLTPQQGYNCHGERVQGPPSASQFLLSVYQFIRPLRFQRRMRNRVLNRKRLLDVRMVRTIGDTWVTFDVKEAVLEWVNGDRNNFGFEIVVKDENETECNAFSMIYPVDCQSPEEIGCREETNEPSMNRLPVFEENNDRNYPYLEIVTRPRHSHSPRRPRYRFRRDVTSRTRDDVTSTPSAQPVHGSNGMCQGREVIINLFNEYSYIIAPSRYTTLVCQGTCAVVSHGEPQISSSSCRATEEVPVIGLYFDDAGRVRLGPLPFSKVVTCGC